jgi:hypothetical protein
MNVRIEPPIGTTAVFSGRLSNGAAFLFGLYTRRSNSWVIDGAGIRPNQSRTWAELTDLPTLNERTSLSTSRSSRMFVSTSVRVIDVTEDAETGFPADNTLMPGGTDHCSASE